MSLTKVSYSMIEGAPVNVLDYGASPTANATTNTAAIQAALAVSNCVYIPPGTYDVSQIVIQNAIGKTLTGASNGATVLRGTVAGTSIIRFGGATVGTNRALLCNLKKLTLSATAAYTYAIECQWMTDANFTDIFVSGANITNGLFLDNSWDNRYYNVYITGCTNGIICGATSSANNNTFFGGRLSGDTTGAVVGIGFDVAGGGNAFYGVDISSYAIGIYSTYGFYGLTVSGCYFEGNNKDIASGGGGNCLGASITGNIFAVGAGSNYGIDYLATAPSTGFVVSGNVFRFKTIAINLGPEFINWDVTTNAFNNCVLEVNGQGTNSAYETGSFTPNITLGSGSVTISSATGKYTKIKNQVAVQGSINLSGVSTPASSLTIIGLPFVCGTQISAVSLMINNSGTNPISGVINASSASATLYKTVAGALANAGDALTATSTIAFSAVYTTT